VREAYQSLSYSPPHCRYSGLRKDDYIDVVDALTSQFGHEIGPARDRESSLRHERWVHAAGGAIRGLKMTKDGRPWVSSLAFVLLLILFVDRSRG
jgi:hypothetical protein